MKSIPRGIWLGVTTIAVGAVIAACNGGSGVAPNAPITSTGNAVTATTSSQAGVAAKRKKLGKARFVIRIPRKKKLTRSMHPEYVSASTQSMTVAVQGGATQTFNLTATSPNCSTDQTTGYLICTEAANIPSGAQTLTVTLYDQQNGKGNQLATATTSVAIASTGFTTIPITLGGVVSTAKVLLGGAATAGVPVGTPTSVPVTVEAYDADGNLIIPPGNYSSPITLTNSDPSGVTSFSSPAPASRRANGATLLATSKERKLKPFDTTTIVAPGGSQTLYYSGGFLAVSTITPSVGDTPQPAGAGTLSATGTLILEFPIPTASSLPNSITAGPDGALWFTEQNSGKIGRITTTGAITEYPTAYATAAPWGIVAGPDGALWFTFEHATVIGTEGYTIGRITTSGTITYVLEASVSANPNPALEDIVVGPDGNLWFTATGLNDIGKVTTAGTLTTYASGSAQSLAAGSDGALWFGVTDYIARLTTGGTVTNLYPFLGGDYPWALAPGPDDALWGTSALNQSVYRITTGGVIATYALPSPPPANGTVQTPRGIVAGPDGALWFAEAASSSIGRISTSGTITEYPVPTANSAPLNITVGPDGNVWFTESASNKIGVVL